MERVFSIISASSGPYLAIWIISIVVCLILVLVAAIFITTGYQSRHLKYTVNDEGLRISPGLYTRSISWEDIDREGIKVLNLNVDTEYQLKRRTNGAGLPGFAAVRLSRPPPRGLRGPASGMPGTALRAERLDPLELSGERGDQIADPFPGHGRDRHEGGHCAS